MTLTYRPTDIAYSDERYQFVAKMELSPIVGYNYYPQDVGDGAVTMGAGLNLTTGKDTNRYAVYSVLGIKVDLISGDALTTTGTPAQQTAEQGYIYRLNDILTSTTLTIDQKRVKLDEVMAARAADSTLDGYADNRRAYFVFDSDAQVRQSFDLAVQFYEQDLRDRLDRYAPNIYADPAFASSKEHVALLSMIWVGGPGGVSTELISAVSTHNRAEAWFEIRYKANKLGYKISQDGVLNAKELDYYNKNIDRVWANRRYAEADMFGLYEDPTNQISIAEAQGIYRMFTAHREQIAAYETVYGIAFDGSLGSRGNNLGNVDYAIHQMLDPAKMTILADLGANTNQDITNAYQAWVVMPGNDPMSFNATDLYLDPNTGAARCYWLDASKDYLGNINTSNSILIGGAADTNYLTSGMGNDLLIGGDFSDTFEGGPGNDVMAGGAGDDTYIINGGGHDTIEDKQGTNRIVLNGQVLCNFTQVPGGHGNYISDDGSLFGSFTLNGDFVVTDNHGNDVTLNQNFQSGDFGITLSDAPQTILPAYTIIGDPLINTATGIAPGSEPADWHVTNTYDQVYDASMTLISYSVDYFLIDGNGNPVEPGGAERTDKLYGTAASDHLLGLGGSDVIFAYGLGGADGGNDILDGGTGRDWLAAGSGNDILIGGTDTDVLEGGLDNDRLYGDSEIATADAIAQGNTHTGSGLIGDWLNAGSGDDILVGGDGNDVLAGGGGRDLLIAGAGDDEIMGDAERKPETVLANWFLNGDPAFNWTVSGEYPRIIDPQPTGIDQPADGAADVIYAGAGNDHVWAGAGDDVVYGEDGNDVLNGNDGSDMIFGGAGDDQIHGDGAVIAGGTVVEGNDYIDGGDGNDTAWGNGGNDILMGGSVDDRMLGAANEASYGNSFGRRAA